MVYQSAAGLLGVEPADLMMVAAHPWDLDGARGAGLRTALVERPLEHGPGSAGYEYAAADESVASLIELAARLEGLTGEPVGSAEWATTYWTTTSTARVHASP